MQVSEPAEYIILGLLKQHAMHGYEMYQYITHGALHHILHLEMSQMYAYLKKLEKLEYIETRLESQGARPPRKVHYLTTRGEESFMHWLVAPVEKPRDIRILFLIKLYFIRQLLPHDARALLDQQVIACERFLNHMELLHNEQLHDGPREMENTSTSDDELFFDHIVLRSRIHQTRALLDWLRELQTSNVVEGKH